MGVGAIYLIHHIVNIYRKITETDLKENQKRFDQVLETTMLIYKYFERINDCI